MAARRFRKNERLTRASARSLPRRPRSAQRTSPPNSTLSYGRERPGRPSHEVRVWLGIRSPTSQDSDYQKRACTEAVTGATDGIVLRAWITMRHIHYMRPSSYERCSRSASSQMQCDVDGQDDPFQSSWQSSARRPYPTNCSAVGKKLSLYIYEKARRGS